MRALILALVLIFTFPVYGISLKLGLGHNITPEPEKTIKDDGLNYDHTGFYIFGLGVTNSDQSLFLNLNFLGVSGTTEKAGREEDFGVTMQALTFGVKPFQSEIIDFYTSAGILHYSMEYDREKFNGFGTKLTAGVDFKINQNVTLFTEYIQLLLFSSPVRNLGGYMFYGIALSF